MGTLKFVSLFCGGGGLDLGFIQAGLMPVAACDISQVAIDHYRRNIGNHAYVLDLAKRKAPLDHDCDVVVAGAPCQGFSTIGKRDYDDPRNNLLGAAVAHAVKLAPKAIVLENVLGLMSGGHRTYLEKATQSLRRHGYTSETRVLDASTLGVAQTRKRVVIIAFKGDRRIDPNFWSQGTSTRSLESVLRGVENQSDHVPEWLSGEKLIISNRIEQGMKLCDVRGGPSSVHTWEIPEVYGAVNASEREVLHCVMRLRRSLRLRASGDADPVQPSEVQSALGRSIRSDVRSLLRKEYLRAIGSRIDLKRTFNGKYRRARNDGCSFTVDTKFGDPTYFLHPSEARGFTVREAARIQGFPDSYRFATSKAESFRLLGNAVPPPLACHVGRAVSSALKS